MRRGFIGIGISLSLVASGCAQLRVPEPAGRAPGTPHVSWVFMYGDSDNPDRDYMCESDPADTCVVVASRDNAPVLSDVHFYYVGAGVETSYSGAIRIGFFRTASVSKPAITVKKDGDIERQSVLGFVTTVAGQYEVSFDLTATTKDGVVHPIKIDVPVTVK